MKVREVMRVIEDDGWYLVAGSLIQSFHVHP